MILCQLDMSVQSVDIDIYGLTWHKTCLISVCMPFIDLVANILVSIFKSMLSKKISLYEEQSRMASYLTKVHATSI